MKTSTRPKLTTVIERALNHLNSESSDVDYTPTTNDKRQMSFLNAPH